jgi:hypothetical protein
MWSNSNSNCKLVQLLGKSTEFLHTLKLGLPYGSSVLLLGIYSKEMKSVLHGCASWTLLTISKIRNQPSAKK